VGGSLQSAILGIVGVGVGVVLKAGIDLLTQKQKNKREDALRFADQRHASYAALLASVMPPLRALEAGRLPDSEWRAALDARAADIYMLTKGVEPIDPIDDLYSAIDAAETQARSGSDADVDSIVSLLGKIANEGRTQLGLPEVDFRV
jgi:hypothetical protein